MLQAVVLGERRRARCRVVRKRLLLTCHQLVLAKIARSLLPHVSLYQASYCTTIFVFPGLRIDALPKLFGVLLAAIDRIREDFIDKHTSIERCSLLIDSHRRLHIVLASDVESFLF